ncbi:MAG: deoxyuridine 5'-triphosphate nucleotidohydrolase [Archaeoglobaceae archaeon]|nr:deoxyuridine 5'-triphosphate nucleotidohydrolase [Archaeoglobaceae archaeon]MCX8152169.1 deoxyuridine 5'-triphosphate nucleotidohydrolase [Archaeoglobaceae archaeon]MDW8013885.1 deoxyuridine 5'-triphosphate nucleotidohydrolase [Archaeoglobaceae archaeon]
MCVLSKDDIRKLIVEKELIRGYVDLEVQLQPNGFDCTLQKVFRIKGDCKVDFDNSERKLAEVEEIVFENWVFLQKGVYRVRLNEVLKIPNDLIAIAKPRSTLARSGVSLITAVWDAGYEGRSEIGLVVHNESGIWLKRNARIVQLIFIKLCRGTESYKGIYLGENI